ncbi:MAG: hypothetical protein WAM13_20565 [Candidatus Sulfotelmatobacter sp.]
MARSCRRLLAACSLIFTSTIFPWTIFTSTILASAIFTSTILAAPILLRGQDTAADHSSFLHAIPAPKNPLSSYAMPIAPVWTPRPPDPPPRYPGVPGSSDFQKLVFRQLVRSAGIIFSGRVVFIGHAASLLRPNPACTTVTFEVQNAIRGASRGRNLTIHEWAGLWTGGERYRIGERVLLFLYSPSRLGLTSPVAGALGKFTMDSQGQVLLSPLHVATFAGDLSLAGKTVVSYADFALMVRRLMREE